MNEYPLDYIMSATTPQAAGDHAPGPQPKLMSAFRRFGRYDNFQPIGSSTSSLGSKSFGKITVDCQLLFNKSQWGILEELPGGIMYLNLAFGQPESSRLREATITITLDEQDACLAPYKAGLPLRTLHPSGAAVHVTEWYGPQTLGGAKKSANTISTTRAVPQVGVLGYSLGGVGHERSTHFIKESRWSFSGQMLRGRRTPTYTTLRWHLNENELDGQSFHNPKIHTAFAFKHSGQPFLVKVEIKGRLQHWHDKLHSNRLRFGVDGAREGKVVTLVDFEDYQVFSRGLDGIARGLPRAMEMENLQSIPMEVPDSVPDASFKEVKLPPSLLQNDAQEPHALDTLGTNEYCPLLQHLSQARTMDKKLQNAAQGSGAFPTAEDYRHVLSLLPPPSLQDLEHKNGKVSVLTSKNTLIDGNNATSISASRAKAEERQSNAVPFIISNVGGNKMLSMVWWALMQLFVNITTLLESGSASANSTDIQDEG